MPSDTPQTPYRPPVATLGDGVAFKEDRQLPAGCWRIVRPGQASEVFSHGRDGAPHRPFNIDTVATEIIEYGNRVFALAPDIHSLSLDVMGELAKRPASSSGMKVTTEDAMLSDAREPRRPESKPDDKLYVETTLEEAEQFLGPDASLREASLAGDNGGLLRATAEAVKAHREGWRPHSPVVTRVQVTDGSPLWQGKIGETAIVTAANLIAPRWMDDNDERCDLTPVAVATKIATEVEELVVPESYAPILTALAEAEVPIEGLPSFAKQLEQDLFRDAPQLLTGVAAATRGPLFEDGARVRFRGRPTNEGDPLVVLSSCYFGEGTEPGEWRYTLSLDGTLARRLTDGPFPESKLAMADYTAAEAAARVMRAYGLKVPLKKEPGDAAGSYHFSVVFEDFEKLPESSDGIQATDAQALWKSLSARRFEVDLEHVLRHGKRGEPSFYRLRVRLRQLGAEDIEKILALAKSYSAEIGWHMKGAAEPVMELT